MTEKKHSVPSISWILGVVCCLGMSSLPAEAAVSVEAVIHSLSDSEASIEVPMAPDWDKPIMYPRGTRMTSTGGWIRLVLGSTPGE